MIMMTVVAMTVREQRRRLRDAGSSCIFDITRNIAADWSGRRRGGSVELRVDLDVLFEHLDGSESLVAIGTHGGQHSAAMLDPEVIS